jgi:hypothetical protein
MITVRAYDPRKDYETLTVWWDGHGVEHTPDNLLPAFGLVVPGVCAGFLYQTDSDLALIEGLISNPETSAQIRDEALDDLVTALCVQARTLGYQAISGFTQVPRVASRAQRHGFKIGDGTYQLVTRRL